MTWFFHRIFFFADELKALSVILRTFAPFPVSLAVFAALLARSAAWVAYELTVSRACVS